MESLPVTLAIRDYEFVAPLALRDVTAEGVDLTLIRTFDALPRVLNEPAVHGGEASFSRYVQRLAASDRTFVGLPAFVMREFRQRSFFVRRDSGLRSVADLAGQRVGMDAWPNSGNTWSRTLPREHGISLDRVHWLVGAVHAGDPSPPPDRLPPGVERARAPLRDLLLAGGIDAFMWAWEPAGFYEVESPIRRLCEDYRAAEREYYRRTRIYPAHHLVVLQRELVDRHPWGGPERVHRLPAGTRAVRPESPAAPRIEPLAARGPRGDGDPDGHGESRRSYACFPRPLPGPRRPSSVPRAPRPPCPDCSAPPSRGAKGAGRPGRWGSEPASAVRQADGGGGRRGAGHRDRRGSSGGDGAARRRLRGQAERREEPPHRMRLRHRADDPARPGTARADGTVVRFDEYPWDDRDEVLLDELCPWAQVNYQMWPPRYLPRTARIRHRLVRLHKLRRG